MKSRRYLAALAAVGGAAVIVGCGVSTDGAITELGQQSPATLASTKPVAPIPLTTTPGQVVIDGVGSGTLTPLAAEEYRTSGGAMSIDLQRNDDAAGFGDLCAGKVDMVDSWRRITKAELATCKAAGLTPVQFQIASDAVVVATKAGVDVGADCATTNQIREMYRAGSPIYDWSQMGFSDAPLHVAGPEPSSGTFQLFGEAALGSEQPGLVDLRSDYQATDDVDRRHYIVGESADAELAAQRPMDAARVSSLKTDAGKAHDSLRAARDELRSARFQVSKGVADKRSKAAKADDKLRLKAALGAMVPAQRWVTRADSDLAAARSALNASGAATKRVGELRGRVGDFRFSYYELFEDQLRPLEVDAGKSSGRACVFPSQQTITDGTYPLSRQLMVTTTTAGMRRPEVRSFLNEYLDNAQSLAAKYQLVPLTDDAVRTQRAWVAGTEAPNGGSGMAGAGSVR